ncbi:MAG: outer membrane beta-barrel protein [Gammaproteobacteria bacterium]
MSHQRTAAAASLAALVLAGVTMTIPGISLAQGYQSRFQPTTMRMDRWEFYFQTRLAMGETLDFDGGTTIRTDDDLGFGFGFGYNFTEQFSLAGEFAFNAVDYDGTLASGDDPPASPERIRGTVDTSSMQLVGTWHLTQGRPWTPYLNAGIGWTWVDTNIATGPPETGCWWDPWWGYICTGFVPTRTEDALNYSVGAGLRYDFRGNLFLRGGYEMRWTDFDNADGAQDFGIIRLEFGVKY